MKTCTECNKEKELAEFYKHKEMLDGHLNKCKECVKSRVSKHRENNIERIMEYDRNRPNSQERVKKCCDRVQRLKTEDPAKYKKYALDKNKWAKNNKHKRNAQDRVAKALYNGKLTRPLKCERCEETKKLHGHHADYNKPLEVIWLCPKCHGLEHKRLNEIKRKEDAPR